MSWDFTMSYNKNKFKSITYNEPRLKTRTGSWTVVMLAFNPITQEAEAGGIS